MPKPSPMTLAELAVAFVIVFAAVVLVNTPQFHFVSAALAVYLGLLVGIPLVSSWLRHNEPSREFGLRGVTSLPGAYFAVALLLPLFLIPLLWSPSIVPTVAFAVVVAPFCEEFFFRGYVAGRLRGFGVVGASVVSALLFGAFHLGALQFQSLTYVAVLALLGLVYAPVYLLTDSVYVTTAAHAGWNLFVYFETIAPRTLLGDFAYVVLGLLLIVYLFLTVLEIMHAQRKATFPAG